MMKKGHLKPPDCCVVMEMESGAYLGYRKAVLLNEIKALGSLRKAARTSRIDDGHARDLLLEMNASFSQPLVVFAGNPRKSDEVRLTDKGEGIAKAYWRRFEPVWLSIVEERSRHY